MALSLALATFGGGCFWCLEAVFEQAEGVQQVVSGYAGGHTQNPTYESVKKGQTGHAEVVQVSFDPSRITYETLLEIFFSTHNPTQIDRQGNDVGTQYRSIVLTHNEYQMVATKNAIAKINNSGNYLSKVVTEVKPYDTFYPAEFYHQDYFRNNPSEAYCRIVISPKVEKFKSDFSTVLK